MVIHDLRNMSSSTVRLIRGRRRCMSVVGQIYPCPDMQWCFVNSSPRFGTIAASLRATLKKVGGKGNTVYSTK